jgi:hypothetical protein
VRFCRVLLGAVGSQRAEFGQNLNESRFLASLDFIHEASSVQRLPVGAYFCLSSMIGLPQNILYFID